MWNVSKKKKQNKTNAVRELETSGIECRVIEYDNSGEFHGGETVANSLGEDVAQVFKTLVLQDGDNNHYVGVLPVYLELDLKAAAYVFGVKQLHMLEMKRLQGLTGYVKGGCSPVGMKKQFPTVIDESALDFDTIYVSAGKRGMQVQVGPRDLAGLIGAKFAPITRPKAV